MCSASDVITCPLAGATKINNIPNLKNKPERRRKKKEEEKEGEEEEETVKYKMPQPSQIEHLTGSRTV